MESALQFIGSFATIVVINLMLSGDNAIVIALAARNLPPRLQGRAILFGTIGAVVVRCAMTLAVVWLLAIPGLLFAGGVALIWIGYKLLLPDENQDSSSLIVKPKGLWGAIRTIVVADMVMGVDNVLGVAGAANGSYVLVVLGSSPASRSSCGPDVASSSGLERFPRSFIGAAALLVTAAKMIAAEPLAQEAASHPLCCSSSIRSVVSACSGRGSSATTGTSNRASTPVSRRWRLRFHPMHGNPQGGPMTSSSSRQRSSELASRRRARGDGVRGQPRHGSPPPERALAAVAARLAVRAMVAARGLPPRARRPGAQARARDARTPQHPVEAPTCARATPRR
jgi:YjbE family integral membrane protein